MYKCVLFRYSRVCPALQKAKLCLRTRSASSQAQPLKPLVVCIGWLGAKRRYLDKYGSLTEALRSCVLLICKYVPVTKGMPGTQVCGAVGAARA